MRPPGWAVELVAGTSLLGVFVASAGLVLDAGDELLRTGARVPGVVVRVHEATRPPSSVDVRFTVDGVERVRTLLSDDRVPPHRVGDQVTVFHDPADPDRVRTEEVANDPLWSTALLAVPLLLGGLLVVRGCSGLFDRRRATRRRR
ncbi:DUF3592 domain-containing protein [Saccharothrix coeruleofusca]|uniref:DUF3592 domain-containing protein n=1 Tax=Saccharothrix coeruleofusca TaxID=33919 RepID=A0A918EGS4_9PSEU|nr:DUF3592 domain-containing protein [Saccharothrix coeruleofusca]GGP83820.1 hypothetical protein GCM10010185_67120 [Saccharothrix coeruleofusca]